MVDLIHYTSPARSRSLAGTFFASLRRYSHAVLSGIHRRRRQRIDREAFLALVGREDWVYDDLGIHPGDVEWLARQPLHVNAARELEALRARSMYGR